MLLDTKQVAARLSLSRAHLAKMRVRGDSPPWVKLGTKVLYPLEDLDRWVAAHGLRRSTAAAPVRAPEGR